MALYYSWAWDVTALGGFKCTVTDDGTPFVLSIPTGTYAHETMASVVSSYTAFATSLAGALNAASDSGTYTVTYNPPPTATYVIAYSGAVLTLDFSTAGAEFGNLARTLGFTLTSHTGATSYTSDVEPYYEVTAAVAGRTQPTREYMPAGNAADAEADDGTAYSIMRGTSPRYYDWSQAAEPLARVFIAEGTSDPPWTWEHAWVHGGNVYPFLCNDGSDRGIYRLRAGSVAFHPMPMDSGDSHLYWSIPFATRLLGRL